MSKNNEKEIICEKCGRPLPRKPGNDSYPKQYIEYCIKQEKEKYIARKNNV